MIYTSNYARKGKDPKSFAISVKPPQWYDGERLPILAPTWRIVMALKEGEITEDQYTKEYITLLKERNVDAFRLVETLPDGCYLLCYESPGTFCHRRVLARWIEHHTGICIHEWRTLQEENAQHHRTIVDSLLSF
jgi:hypothetical protein